MKVFIVGIAGRTGLRVAKLLATSGKGVGGLYRRQEQTRVLTNAGIDAQLGDIVTMDAAQLADAIRGSDVVLFTAGAGGKDSDAATDMIDGHGVTKMIEAARLAAVGRFYLVSVFPEAWRDRHMDESFENYIAIKKRAEIELSHSGLDWVILRPSELLDEPGAGTVSLGVVNVHTQVRRDDVAATIVGLIDTPEVKKAILEVTEGSTPISEAVARMTNQFG